MQGSDQSWSAARGSGSEGAIRTGGWKCWTFGLGDNRLPENIVDLVTTQVPKTTIGGLHYTGTTRDVRVL